MVGFVFAILILIVIIVFFSGCISRSDAKETIHEQIENNWKEVEKYMKMAAPYRDKVTKQIEDITEELAAEYCIPPEIVANLSGLKGKIPIGVEEALKAKGITLDERGVFISTETAILNAFTEKIKQLNTERAELWYKYYQY
jgi:hypothetical protein